MEILPATTATLAEALRLPYVAIALDANPAAPAAAASGAPLGEPTTFLLRYQGAVVGALRVYLRRRAGWVRIA